MTITPRSGNPERTSLRARVHAGYVPIRHRPRPPEPARSRHPSVGFLIGAVATVITVWLTWRQTGSVPVTVFAALVGGYAARTITSFGVGKAWARALVALMASGGAIGVLFLAASAWGWSWAAVAAALGTGAVLHTVLARAMSPGLPTG
jgi:hypothetical protein